MVFHDDFCEISGIEQAHYTKCKPSELLIRCGQRLSEFAKTYEVPFQYTAIADKWENITATQLALRPDEVLVVNVAYKLSNLFDESVVVANPRQMFLNKIRSMNPKVNANYQRLNLHGSCYVLFSKLKHLFRSCSFLLEMVVGFFCLNTSPVSSMGSTS
jgi:hypothetical protein